MGDTTQTHIVTTVTGDVFTGRVSAYGQDKITFIYGANTMTFGVDEIKLIEVKGPAQTNPDAAPAIDTVFVGKLNPKTAEANYLWRFDYKIRTNNGQEYIGKVNKLNQNLLQLNNGKAGKQNISIRKVREITHLGRNPSASPMLMPEYHRLITQDKNNFIGILLAFDGHEITFMLKGGSELKFKLNEINQLTFEENTDTKWLPGGKTLTDFSHNQQRVFFSPSAHTLEKGTSEFRTMIFYNNIDHGLTNNITIGTGLFSVIAATAFTGKVKIGASLTDNLHVAIGGQGMVALPTFDSGEFSLGLFYGSVSVGSVDNFINVSVGRGKSSDDSTGSMGFAVGARFKTGEHWSAYLDYLQFDSSNGQYYNPDKTALGNLGLSWHKYQHQIDFGIVVIAIFDETVAALPIFAYSYKF